MMSELAYSGPTPKQTAWRWVSSAAAFHSSPRVADVIGKSARSMSVILPWAGLHTFFGVNIHPELFRPAPGWQPLQWGSQ